MLGTCAQDPKTAKERATRWEGCLEEEMFDLCLRKTVHCAGNGWNDTKTDRNIRRRAKKHSMIMSVGEGRVLTY